MRENQIGWFNPRSQTVKKEKEEGGLPPILWTKRDFDEFDRMYPELKDY